MADASPVPPVTEPERRRVERLNVAACLAAGALLAALHLAVTALLGVGASPDLYPLAVLAYALAIGGWVIGSGRSLGYLGDPRRLDFKGRVGYRSSRLGLPLASIAVFGLVLDPVWAAGSYALAVGGLVGLMLVLVAGASGRFPVCSPRPLREGWPEVGTGPLPHLYPGFVDHVVWMRRVRAAVLGGDPRRPLVAPSHQRDGASG